VVAIAGQTITGGDDNVQEIHDWLDAYEHPPDGITARTTVVPWKRSLRWRRSERQLWVGSVSSPLQEPAGRLLDAATVSKLPHC